MFDIYSIRTGYQTVSVAQDLLEIVAGTSAGFKLIGFRLDQSSDVGAAAEKLLQVSISRAAGAYLSGSGGAAVTPTAYANSAAPAPTMTAERNNTTQASAGSGSLTTIDDFVWNVRSGMVWIPPDRLFPMAQTGEALIISVVAPADALTLSCVAWVQHVG